METKGLSQEFFDALMSYGWPGNVRELVQTLDAAIASARDDPMLFSQHLPTPFRVEMVRASIRREKPEGITHLSRSLPKLRDFRQSIESKYLQDLMSRTGRDIKRACQISGLSRSHLYELLSKHGLVSSNP
jgi:two-component system NtrC family response regulator